MMIWPLDLSFISSCIFLAVVQSSVGFNSPWGVPFNGLQQKKHAFYVGIKNDNLMTHVSRSAVSRDSIISTKAKKTGKEAVEDREKKGKSQEPSLRRVLPDEEGVPLPFVDVEGQSFIECYPDSVATVAGMDYTIGVPCDYAVALCRFDANEQLLPIELDDQLMDDIYPIAEGIVEEEFGDELVLQRTPQTLTLVGELEEDDDEDEDDDSDYDELLGEEDDDDIDEDEEVEVLLSFDYDGTEYSLVRLLDPILLVGKHTNSDDPLQSENRILLTKEESEKVMPVLEKMFLEAIL